MDKLTQKAFEKLEKAEHLTRTAYDLLEQGRLSKEMFDQRIAAVKRQYALTAAEQKAYEAWDRRRKSK